MQPQDLRDNCHATSAGSAGDICAFTAKPPSTKPSPGQHDVLILSILTSLSKRGRKSIQAFRLGLLFALSDGQHTSLKGVRSSI